MTVPSIELVGVERLQKLLRGIERRGTDMRPLFRGKINKSMTSMFKRQYASKGEFSGDSWARLRPSTRRWRQRIGGNRGGTDHPLWDTGAGKASLEKVGPNSFLRITRSTYERGSTLPYMALHQSGFTVRSWGGRTFKSPRKVPARKSVPDPPPTPIVLVWEVLIARYMEFAV